MDFYKQKEFEEKIVQTKRVSKKTTGGNKIGFSALVVVGNKKGKVGFGLGKAPDISSAIQKGTKEAKDNLIDVQIKGTTIPHEVKEKYKSSIIMLKPAPEGSGVIAGGAVRHVLELAGVKDVSAKLLGSNNRATSVQCAINALTKLKKES